MINFILSLVRDKRVDNREYSGDRRRPTLKDANRRLQHAAEKFSDTVTLSPDRVRELLQRTKR